MTMIVTAMMIIATAMVDDAGRLFGRAYALHQEGRAAEAIVLYDAAERAGMRTADLYFNRALSAVRLERWTQADTDLGRVLAERHDDNARYTRAYCRAMAGAEKAAIADLDTLIATTPSFPRAHLLRAQVRWNVGDTAGACADARIAEVVGDVNATEARQAYCP